VVFDHDIDDREYGFVTSFTMPGGVKVDLYEPKYLKRAVGTKTPRSPSKPKGNKTRKQTAKRRRRQSPAPELLLIRTTRLSNSRVWVVEPAGVEGSSRTRREARDLKRTKWGLLLVTVNGVLVFGFFSGFLFLVLPVFPFILFAGGLPVLPAAGLLMIGGALMLLSSKTFGPRHFAFTTISLAIFVLMDVLVIGGVFGYGLAIPFAAVNIGNFFLSYELQNRMGRALLWLALAGLLSYMVVYFWQSSLGVSPILDFSQNILLGSIGLYVAAFANAYWRMDQLAHPETPETGAGMSG
jgi:hypothetical protein